MTEDIAGLQALPELEPTSLPQLGRADLCAFTACLFITCITSGA
jgi:hypothetical protein